MSSGKDNGIGDSKKSKTYFNVPQTICDRIYIENDRRFKNLETANSKIINDLQEIKNSINNFTISYIKKEATNKALIIIGKIAIVIIPILLSSIGIAALYLTLKKDPNINLEHKKFHYNNEEIKKREVLK